MRLYEINENIAAILAALEPDDETGELPIDEEQLLDQLARYESDRTEVLKWLAKEQLNCKAEADAAQLEIERLRKKKDRAATKAEHLLAILDRECAGKKTELGVATLCYRKSRAIVLDDEAAAAGWLADNGYEDGIAYTVKVSKAVVKRAIDDGAEVAGAHVDERLNASLR